MDFLICDYTLASSLYVFIHIFVCFDEESDYYGGVCNRDAVWVKLTVGSSDGGGW